MLFDHSFIHWVTHICCFPGPCGHTSDQLQHRTGRPVQSFPYPTLSKTPQTLRPFPFSSPILYLLSRTFISSSAITFVFASLCTLPPTPTSIIMSFAFLILTFQDGLATHTTPAAPSPYQPAVIQPSTEPSPQVSQPQLHPRAAAKASTFLLPWEKYDVELRPGGAASICVSCALSAAAALLLFPQ